MGWAVHAARTVERIENGNSEKIKILHQWKITGKFIKVAVS